MNFQTDLTSKPFHHLQHILTAKISSSEDRKYLSLQRTTNTGTIQASMLHISARDQLKAWTGTSVFLSKVTFPTSLQISLCNPNESAFMCFSSAPTKWCIVPCLLNMLAMRMKGKTWATQEEFTRSLFFWDSQQARQVLPAGIKAYGLKTYILWDNIRSFFHIKGMHSHMRRGLLITEFQAMMQTWTVCSPFPRSEVSITVSAHCKRVFVKNLCLLQCLSSLSR